MAAGTPVAIRLASDQRLCITGNGDGHPITLETCKGNGDPSQLFSVDTQVRWPVSSSSGGCGGLRLRGVGRRQGRLGSLPQALPLMSTWSGHDPRCWRFFVFFLACDARNVVRRIGHGTDLDVWPGVLCRAARRCLALEMRIRQSWIARGVLVGAKLRPDAVLQNGTDNHSTNPVCHRAPTPAPTSTEWRSRAVAAGTCKTTMPRRATRETDRCSSALAVSMGPPRITTSASPSLAKARSGPGLATPRVFYYVLVQPTARPPFCELSPVPPW